MLKKNFACCQIKSAPVFPDVLDAPFRTGTIRHHFRTHQKYYIYTESSLRLTLIKKWC